MIWDSVRRQGARVLWALLVVAALLVGAIVVNVVGIHLLGNIEAWQAWLADHAGYFVIWRVLFYGGTAWGWVWMRRRLLARETSPEARARLRRAEIAAAVGIVALEAGQLLSNH